MQAQARELAWIRHCSVRRAGGFCGAVLRPAALRQPFEPQTRVCKATRDGVFLSRELRGDKLEFSAAAWH